MEGYVLTEIEKDSIQGKNFAPFEYLNCVQDINDIWFTFVSNQQIPLVQSSEYYWILNLPQNEYIPKPLPPIF